MNAALDKKIRFGDVTVDPQSNLITVVGKEKRLEPKLVALLMYLARHSQQVITRQQITETIWPSVVVGEESITQAIFSLRNALGDDAKRPKYIETIPKKGYRFLVDIVDTEQQQETPTTATTPRRHWSALGVLASLIVMGLIAVGLILRLTPQSDYEIGSVLPVTKMAGAECCMAIRGNKMAFINSVDTSSNDIYLQDLTTGIQERITEDKWHKSPVSWLDDNTLIYPRCSNTECQIVQQSLHKAPQVIYTSADYINQMALAPNNPSVFVFNEQHDTSNFITYDLRSGKMAALHQDYPELPPYSFAPQFSLDAQQLYFLTINPKPIIMRLDFATKKITTVTDHFDEITSFSLEPQGQLLVAGTRTSTIGLWSLGEHNEPRLIMRPSGDEKFLFPLMHGQAIYYQSAQFDRDIGTLSNNSDRDTELSAINSTGIDEWAIPSKDEQFVYFVSNRSGYSEVWRHDRVRKQTKQITQLKTVTLILILPSNDGQRFSAMYTENLQPMIGVFSVHTGELLASVKSQSYPLSWSPDDKHIYVKDYNDNFPVLSRYDSQRLVRTEIQKNAGLFAQESDDGNTLTFIDFAKNALVERTLATGQDKVLINPDFKLDKIWTGRLRMDATKTSMLVIKSHQEAYQLWQYALTPTGSPPQKLMDLPQYAQATYISGDGTQVFYDKEMPATGSIMKIELK